MEQVIPFNLAANVPTKIPAGMIPWARACMKIVPLGDAKIYAWVGRELTSAECTKDLSAATPSWDLAAGAYAVHSPEIEINAGGAEFVTLFAIVAADGYLFFREYDRDYETRVAAAVERALRR